MSTIAFDQFALTRIADFARSLSRLHQAARRQRIDDDQTYRYSEASGDPMPIHLDEEFAKQMGLPGIIAHGTSVEETLDE